jgi:uncharacterized protein (TIGR04255 family)
MTMRPSDLPDFSNPPVVETVLSVQFDRLTAMRAAHAGLYWGEVKARFPRVEERAELPAMIERKAESPQPPVQFRFEALESPPTPRFWFIDTEGTELIQLQRDRFLKNWRKTGDGDAYPRYEFVHEGFQRDFSKFQDFASRNKLGAIRINQCEVTYINHIVAGKGWEVHSDVDKVFTLWKQPTTRFPGAAQDLVFQARFPIVSTEGEFVGRLHATMRCGANPADGTPMFLLELTARGQLRDGTEFFDLGREWIVRSFKELTTPEMHEIWGIRS